MNCSSNRSCFSIIAVVESVVHCYFCCFFFSLRLRFCSAVIINPGGQYTTGFSVYIISHFVLFFFRLFQYSSLHCSTLLNSVLRFFFALLLSCLSFFSNVCMLSGAFFLSFSPCLSSHLCVCVFFFNAPLLPALQSNYCTHYIVCAYAMNTLFIK